MTVNRRHARRHRIRHPAWLMPAPEHRIDCFVTDVSAGGARIQVDNDADVPDCFALLLSNNGTPRRFCRVVWRKPHQIGVKFEASFAAAASLAPLSLADERAVPPPIEMDEPADAL